MSSVAKALRHFDIPILVGSGFVFGVLYGRYKYEPVDEPKVKGTAETAALLLGGSPENDKKSYLSNQNPRKSESTSWGRRFKEREAIQEAIRVCERHKAKHGLPGLSVAVSVNGDTVWSQGFGYANLEHDIKMRPDTVMRIASISKSMTMGMLGKFIESGQLDIDLPIQTYLPDFPKKEVDGKEVTITTRQLLSHLSGIRHYITKEELVNQGEGPIDEMNLKEYFVKEKFESVQKSLELFQHDELLHAPGTKYLYTTHGWTVVSAILEKLAGTTFPKYAKRVFKTWGLQNTYLDEPDPIIYHRAAPYTLDKKTGLVQNSPYVDNSYKWAGGGFLSTVEDIVQFGNLMLASFQNNVVPSTNNENGGGLGYLQSPTVQTIWTGDPRTARKNTDRLYGLGFTVRTPMRNCLFCASHHMMTVSHTGVAIGGSSIFSITFPKSVRFSPDETDCKNPPSPNDYEVEPIPKAKVKGVVVAMATNLTDIGLREPAEEITKLFESLV